MKKRHKESIDNLFFMMDESFDRVSLDFWEMFSYNKKRQVYTHEDGSTIKLHKELPPFIMRKLSKEEERNCASSYNLGGVISTPINGSYGIVIPALKDIMKYCYLKRINSAFPDIYGEGKILHHDPENPQYVPLHLFDRRVVSLRFLKKDRRKQPVDRTITVEGKVISFN